MYKLDYTFKEYIMKASVVDLRYRMNEVLKALNRNEDVKILYWGKLKGVIKAARGKSELRVFDHPFYNMYKDDGAVEELMDRLRGGWCRDIWYGCFDLDSAGKRKGRTYSWTIN